jgi:hypothetical protein
MEQRNDSPETPEPLEALARGVVLASRKHFENRVRGILEACREQALRGLFDGDPTGAIRIKLTMEQLGWAPDAALVRRLNGLPGVTVTHDPRSATTLFLTFEAARLVPECVGGAIGQAAAARPVKLE